MILTPLKALLHLAKVPRWHSIPAAQQPSPFPCLGFTIPWLLAKPGEGSICYLGCGQPSQPPEKAALGPGAREPHPETPVLGAAEA